LKEKIKIGIIGGSGFYHFLRGKEVKITTPYGNPSDKILISEFRERKIAFLPRHGRNHQLPPHKIPFLANIYAFYKLGVERVIAPCAVGSLTPKIKRGDFVIANDFFDFTKQRRNTFYDGKFGKISKKVFHLSPIETFCPELRKIAIECCKRLKIPFRKEGRVVVIEGPRFSTVAESSFFQKVGNLINMTLIPEATLARELGMCYLNISVVTDYDVGLKGRKDIKPVTAKEVLETFSKNIEKLKKLILEIIPKIPLERKCSCSQVLKDAEVG
jgi:5'-methylthioadenosine phosphorylase